MAQPSFHIPDDLLDKVNEELSYGDSRSEWVREAIRMKLTFLEEIETSENLTPEERVEIVREALREWSESQD